MDFVHNMDLNRRYTTKANNLYWKQRETGWEEYLGTWQHPHRYFLSHILKQLKWISLLEVGCGSGPNLRNIVEMIGGKQLGGVDINPHAIAIAQKTFKGGFFKVSSGDDIMMTDKSTDITLTDMYLIYIAPLKIKKYLREIQRVTRNNIVLCEFHSESWWERLKLRVLSGRHSYNYKKLLPKLGFFDVQLIKVPAFEEALDNKFRYVIIARTPKK